MSLEEEASQTVKLWLGAIDDGKIKGKVAMPAVATTPIMLRDVPKKPTMGFLFLEIIEIINPKKATMVAIIALLLKNRSDNSSFSKINYKNIFIDKLDNKLYMHSSAKSVINYIGKDCKSSCKSNIICHK